MIPEHELREMYVDDNMSQKEIAEIYGVCRETISRWIKSYDIKTRDFSEVQLIGICVPGKDEFEHMYYKKRMSQSEIAETIGVSRTVVINRMKKYGIVSRTNSKSLIGKLVGEKNGNWNGGTSFILYCRKFNNRFKEAVRERDDYTCQLCGFEQNGEKLHIHHIHYDKDNCYPDVVSLCRSCHTKTTSGDRDYWEEYFENQLIDRGLFCWSISREIDNT